MSIEEAVAKRLQDLVDEAESLRRGNKNGGAYDYEQVHQCAGWLTSALNLVQILCPSESNAFRKRAEDIAARKSGGCINNDVGEFMSLLQNLARDIDAGLLTSIADRARAETFDEFLDHGRAYLKEQKKQEAGVICGVVFEDTVRRICRKYNIEEVGVQLDSLISALTKIEVLTGAKAKRARCIARPNKSDTCSMGGIRHKRCFCHNRHYSRVNQCSARQIGLTSIWP